MSNASSAFPTGTLVGEMDPILGQFPTKDLLLGGTYVRAYRGRELLVFVGEEGTWMRDVSEEPPEEDGMICLPSGSSALLLVGDDIYSVEHHPDGVVRVYRPPEWVPQELRVLPKPAEPPPVDALYSGLRLDPRIGELARALEAEGGVLERLMAHGYVMRTFKHADPHASRAAALAGSPPETPHHRFAAWRKSVELEAWRELVREAQMEADHLATMVEDYVFDDALPTALADYVIGARDRLQSAQAAVMDDALRDTLGLIDATLQQGSVWAFSECVYEAPWMLAIYENDPLAWWADWDRD